MFCIEIDPQFCGNTFWCQNMYLGVKYLPTTGYLGAGISVVTLQSFKGMHLVTKSTNKETNYLPNKQKKKTKFFFFLASVAAKFFKFPLVDMTVT